MFVLSVNLTYMPKIAYYLCIRMHSRLVILIITYFSYPIPPYQSVYAKPPTPEALTEAQSTVSNLRTAMEGRMEAAVAGVLGTIVTLIISGKRAYGVVYNIVYECGV